MNKNRLSDGNTDKNTSIFPYLKYLTRPYWKYMGWGVIGLIALNLVLLTVPKIIGNIIDSYAVFTPHDLTETRNIIKGGVSLIVISLLIFGMRIFWRFLFIIIPSYNIKKRIKNDVFEHILSLSSESNKTYSVGEQIALMSRETDQISRSISWGFVLALDGIFAVIGIYTVLLVSYRAMAWPSLLIYPLVFLYIFFFFKKLSKSYRYVQEHIASMSELTREMFQQIATIKGFNSEKYYSQRFLKKGNALIKAKIKIAFFQGLFFPIAMVLNSCAIVLAIYFGIRAIQNGSASVGDFSAVLAYLLQVSFPFIGLGFSLNSIMNGLASARRIKALLDVKSSIVERNTLAIKEEIPLNIELENIEFEYEAPDSTESNDADDAPATQNIERFQLGPISLSIAESSWIGITGDIGSGKSTLAKLLVRLHDVKKGSIRYQGNDIKDFALKNLHEHVLLQNQQFSLFSQTISQNIAFIDGELTEEEGEQVMEYGIQAGLKNDVEILPEHWDTQIGESGILLSGGQKQRVSLARSVIKNTRVLILDDIFSGLDYKTATFVINNLKELRKDKTTILISHNLSVLRQTDSILVMDKGNIAEQGSHELLLSQEQGLYAQSWHKHLISEGKEFEE